MKSYKFKFKEINFCIVTVEANSLEEAEQILTTDYNNGVIDDFTDTEIDYEVLLF
jgi:hypothetical protein